MKRIITAFLMIPTILLCFIFQGCDNFEFFEKELTAEEIFEFASPSVVEIIGKTKTGTSTGTGFFYDNKGTVVTNYHVIEGCTEATITLSNGNSYNVDKVLGYSKDKDIAVLSTSCANSSPLKICDTEIKTGEKVYTIGSSLGLSGSLSDGIVSSAEREINNNTYIQTTAPISHGNSGGPLLDSKGKVIGITTAYLVEGQNLNLAIPIVEIKNISTSNPISLDELFLSYIESNPSEALGITQEQYKIATMISDDPITYCEYIADLMDTLSKGTYGYEVQVEKATDYINNISLEYGQKIILFRMIFMLDDTYNYEIIDYLNGRDDISYEEMEYILEELGFAVFSDGTIEW